MMDLIFSQSTVKKEKFHFVVRQVKLTNDSQVVVEKVQKSY